jgi:outer membrane lipoprotein-sorting protein
MIKINVFAVLAAIVLLLPQPSSAQRDAKAREWLDKSSSAFSKAGALSLNFTLTIQDVSNKLSESVDGTLDLKGEQFHLTTPDYEIWFNGKTQWLLQKDFAEVQISEPSEQELQALNPALVLNIYQKGCNYKYRGEKTNDKGRKVQEVELIPQAKDNEMSRIILEISASDSMLSRIHLFYKSKMENIILINKQQKNTALTDTNFVLKSI